MAVTDPADIRILVPRVRRMIDGPQADSPSAGASTLSDEQITGLIADAISDVILATGGTWGYTLTPVGAVDDYLQPESYTTSPPLDGPSQALVATVAALGYLYRVIGSRKVSETQKDEGNEWTYSVSASILRDWLKALQAQRDFALEQLIADGAPLDVYSSFVSVRDSEAAAVAESWVTSQ